MFVRYEDDETVLEMHVSSNISEHELIALISDAKWRISAPRRHDALPLSSGREFKPKAIKEIPKGVVEYETIPQTAALFFETLKNVKTSAWCVRQMLDTSPQMTAVISRLSIIG